LHGARRTIGQHYGIVVSIEILLKTVISWLLASRAEREAEESGEQSCGNDGRRKSKGCDIGYALAISSCEGAISVEACTVTALDAITAFAVPNPNGLLAEPSVFSGLDAHRVAPPS
jgi:hypothetical protein